MYKKIALIIASIIVLFIAYNLINQIVGALRSGDRLSEATEDLYRLEIQNKELKKRLTEIKSINFIEQQARDKLGLAREGEIVVIIPEEVWGRVLGMSQKPEEIKLPNWLGWLKVFFK